MRSQYFRNKSTIPGLYSYFFACLGIHFLRVCPPKNSRRKNMCGVELPMRPIQLPSRVQALLHSHLLPSASNLALHAHNDVFYIQSHYFYQPRLPMPSYFLNASIGIQRLKCLKRLVKTKALKVGYGMATSMIFLPY